jgi:hypothetical protein
VTPAGIGPASAFGIEVKLRKTTISIPAEHAWLDGELSHAPDVRGLAAILRPAGSDPARSRELEIAQVLQQAGYATLVINLLTTYEESRDPDARYNVPQMANRVVAVADWIGHQPPLAGLAVGLLASDTACGAAIRAAWKAPAPFAAIVCAAGRPDLAGATPLNALSVPIRLVVGSEDPHAAMLRNAFEHVGGPRDWQTLDDAGEDFADTITLQRFARLAGEWLDANLPPPAAEPPSAQPAAEPSTSATPAISSPE